MRRPPVAGREAEGTDGDRDVAQRLLRVGMSGRDGQRGSQAAKHQPASLHVFLPARNDRLLVAGPAVVDHLNHLTSRSACQTILG
jgi:hypothetical protein